MKNTALLFLISFIFSSGLYSQGCGWEDFAEFQNSLDYDFTNWTSGGENFEIQLVAHIELDGSGNPVADDAFVDASFDTLRAKFDKNALGIDFVRSSCTQYFSGDLQFEVESSDNTIDVYFYDPNYVGSSWGGLASKTNLYLRGRFRNLSAAPPVAHSYVIAHEVGHILGLEHTFAQTAAYLEFSETDNTPDPTQLNPPLLPEPVAKTILEGITTGDKIWDTKADPFGTFSSVLPWCPFPETTNPEVNYRNCRRTPHDCKSIDDRVFDQDERNIMSYAHYSCVDDFTTMQKNFMRHNLRTHPLLKTLVRGELSLITTTKVLDCDHFIDSDVTIASGGTLRVTSQGRIKMAEGKKITVQSGGTLQVDNTIITNSEVCGGFWEGIVAEQGANLIFANATIENANNAIAIKEAAIGDLATLTITDCINGVVVDGVVDQPISLVTFTNISQFAIHSIGSTVQVTDCGFHDCNVGIRLDNLGSQMGSSSIGREAGSGNFFQNCTRGIYSSFQHDDDLLIANNVFDGGSIGVHVDGLSFSRIIGNDFYDVQTAGFFSASGFFENNFEANQLSRSDVANFSRWSNDLLSYVGNCYDNTTFEDIGIGPGSISFEQGNAVDAASNSFSKIPNVPSITTHPVSADVDYFIKENTPTSDSKYPLLESSTTVTLNDAIGELNVPCGTGIQPPPSGPSDPRCVCGSTEAETNQKLSLLISEFFTVFWDFSVGASYKKYLLAQYNTCIQRLFDCQEDMLAVDSCGWAARGDDMVHYYSTLDFHTGHRRAIDFLICREEYQQAEAYLVSEQGKFDMDESAVYESVLQVYLRYLVSGQSNSADLIYLRTEAENSSHYSSIARSLLCVLDGDCRYPTVERNTVQPRSASTNTQPRNISVVPTVALDHLQITNINVGTVLLYDVTGALRHEEAVDTNATMDISHLTAGIYVLVYTEAGTDYSESVKIVKL